MGADRWLTFLGGGAFPGGVLRLEDKALVMMDAPPLTTKRLLGRACVSLRKSCGHTHIVDIFYSLPSPDDPDGVSAAPFLLALLQLVRHANALAQVLLATARARHEQTVKIKT